MQQDDADRYAKSNVVTVSAPCLYFDSSEL